MRMLRWLPVAILTAALAAVVALFVRGGEARMVSWYAALSALPVLGIASVLGAALRLLWRRKRTPALMATLLLGLVASVPGSWALRIWPVAYPSSLESAGPGIRIRVPTDKAMRVAWGGDDPAGNQHAIMADQRWAYDLMIPPLLTGGAALQDYGCYGATVVAPIAGEVVAQQNERPDMTPGTTDPEWPLGNHVFLKPQAGGYLLIAHLQQGSVRVKLGQQVVEGEVLGRCGNSGNTSEPHIHIHYQRQHPGERPLMFADGLPLYFRDHHGPEMPTGGIATSDDKLIATGDVIHHRAR